ncbi:MAG TPA: hypothetical protein VIL84_13515 [Devosiaceae bacterium]
MITPKSTDGQDVISGHSFSLSDLSVDDRKPGISAFMRIRNGADFLETTIESHIEYFDEIVAVHNQCTDTSPAILMRLKQRHGEKLRVVHYTDRVFPPGSVGHAQTPKNAPQSLVNYYNVALALTRYQFATKLDDDHLGIEEGLADAIKRVREDRLHRVMHCFSGLNLARRAEGTLGVTASNPISGNGDIGFFPVSEKTVFGHDRRFETFRHDGLRREFVGFLYWHLKYLKKGNGFDNYELSDNPESRYHKQRERFRGSEIVTVEEVAARLGAKQTQVWLLSPFIDKARLRRDQIKCLRSGLPSEDLITADRRLSQYC